MEYYVYMLRCHGELLYTGITADIKKRMREHVLALPAGAKFTRAHKPEAIVGLWKAENKSVALKLEYRIKTLKREEKLALIEHPETLTGMTEGTVVSQALPSLSSFIEE